jgi:kynurenine formamidase
MILLVKLNNRTYEIDPENPLDISIPLDFGGAQPNVYEVEKASANPCEAGSLVGDTRRGGSCNFEQVQFIPHCNGTHTECAGHVTHERISVRDCLQDAFAAATLITIESEKASDASESYSIDLSEEDRLITRRSLEKVLQRSERDFLDALIIRTLPNDAGKLTKTYLETVPPFFSTEAIQFIAEKNVKHLLVDLPSIDRIFDEGNLSNHRIFWNIGQGEFETNEQSFVHRTITELIYVADEIADGNYLLNLQIAPFAADASPSRPILFRVFPS